MQVETDGFAGYALDLLAVLERLPFPIAVAFDTACKRIQGNQAFRLLPNLSSSESAGAPLRIAAARGVEVIDCAVQIPDANGAPSDLIVSSWPLRDGAGAVAGSIGVFVDVTQRKAAEMHRYRLITDAMHEFVWLDEPGGKPIYANRRWLEYTGFTAEQNAAYGWKSVMHPDDAARLATDREQALQLGQTFEGECRYRGKDGKYRWFLFRSIAVTNEDGSIECRLSTATDIDKQKRAQAQQAFLALASDALGSTLDVNATLERIARLAIASIGTWCQIDLADASADLRVALVAHEDPEKQALLSSLIDHRIYNPDAQLGPPAVMRTLKPQLLQRVAEKAVEHVIPEARHRDVYRKIGYAAGLMVPLRTQDRVLGVLGIASDDSTRLYTEFDIATAAELARRGAVALENAQSFAREHRLATTLQRALLPASLPRTAGVTFWPAYSAAPSSNGEAVGGDWYDAFALDADSVAVSMGDVAGHGVEAAVTMGVVRQAIRAAALERRAPREVLERANRIIALENRHAMITALFGVYDRRTREFTFGLAGHPCPIVGGPENRPQPHAFAGPPLGDAFKAALVKECALPLEPGTSLVFFTDGLLEYDRNLERAHARLRAAAADAGVLGCENPAQAIISAVLDRPARDDIAVLVMRTDL